MDHDHLRKHENSLKCFPYIFTFITLIFALITLQCIINAIAIKIADSKITKSILYLCIS